MTLFRARLWLEYVYLYVYSIVSSPSAFADHKICNRQSILFDLTIVNWCGMSNTKNSGWYRGKSARYETGVSQGVQGHYASEDKTTTMTQRVDCDGDSPRLVIQERKA